jgi:GNAT superfamily N-acetyltransferase
MIIREVLKDDGDALFLLSIQLGYKYPLEKLMKKLEYIIKSDEHKIYVAVDSTKIVGYIHVHLYRSLFIDDLLNILGIVVDQEYRAQGVGTALLKSAELFADTINCKGLRASSGKERLSAHTFYEKRGFASFKEHKTYIKYFE